MKLHNFIAVGVVLLVALGISYVFGSEGGYSFGPGVGVVGTDTLQDVVNRGASTTNAISPGGVDLNGTYSLILDADRDTKIYSSADGVIDIVVESVTNMTFESDRVKLRNAGFDAFLWSQTEDLQFYNSVGCSAWGQGNPKNYGLRFTNGCNGCDFRGYIFQANIASSVVFDGCSGSFIDGYFGLDAKAYVSGDGAGIMAYQKRQNYTTNSGPGSLILAELQYIGQRAIMSGGGSLMCLGGSGSATNSHDGALTLGAGMSQGDGTGMAENGFYEGAEKLAMLSYVVSATNDNFKASTNAAFTISKAYTDDIAKTNLQTSFTIYDDGDWDSEVTPIWTAPDDGSVTVTKIRVAVYGSTATSLTFNVEERAWAGLNLAGTDMMAADQHAMTNGTTITTFANAGIAANAHLVVTTPAGSASGTVDCITGSITYYKD